MITDALGARPAAYYRGGLVFDLGAGTGHHLAGVLDALPPETFGLATDVSKAAVRVAARAHPRADAVVCDAWQPLPIADATVGVALDVFAPRPGAEFARVLRPDGVLLVVTPTAEHLPNSSSRSACCTSTRTRPTALGAARLAAFALIEQEPVGGVMHLEHAEIATLVGMGPSAWHTDPAR